MSAAPTLARATPTSSDDLESEELYEIVDGIRVEMPPMSAEGSKIAFELAFHLESFGRANNLGCAAAEMLFHLPLPLDRNRRPDVAFVPFSRWPRSQKVPPTNAWDVLPEIVAEVISPSESMSDVVDKLDEYFRSGISLAWLVFPKQESVYVYESLTRIRVLTRNDALDGGNALPGFHLPLAELFG